MSYIVIAPTFGTTRGDCHHNAWGWGNPVIDGGISPHDRSRGMLAGKALQLREELRPSGSIDYALWIDFDIGATKEEADRLVEQAVKWDADMMTGIYVCRHYARRGKLALNVNLQQPGDLHFGPGGEVKAIVACGFGFVVTRLDIFEDMISPRVRYDGVDAKAWFLPLVRGLDHLGEDRSFCVRLREQKPRARMFADLSNCVPHDRFMVHQLLRG